MGNPSQSQDLEHKAGPDSDSTMWRHHLEQAQRHVSRAEGYISRQRELIEGLARDGHDTRQAEGLLREFEQTLALHKADCDRLEAEFAKSIG